MMTAVLKATDGTSNDVSTNNNATTTSKVSHAGGRLSVIVSAVRGVEAVVECITSNTSKPSKQTSEK